jgi:hypothetical protein
MENRFFRWRGFDASPSQFVPAELLPQLPPTDVTYFVRILQHLDHLLPAAGLTFFLTWHLDAFDEAMEDAVVILSGDERYQTPSYRGRVRAIFKVAGVHRSPLRETLRLSPPIAWRVLLRDARNGAVQVKRRLQYGLPGRELAPMYEIPLGTDILLDIDPPPIDQRPVDVFFAGGSAPGWTLRAKFVARKQMAAAVAAARSALPEYRIETILVTNPTDKRFGPEAYTESLANAKIALAPRGNSDESCRLFEAAKLGCVVVAEPLPSRWYYQGCPVVRIPKWSALPDVLSSLLSDPARLTQLSLRTRQWWDSTLSEAAIAKFIAQKLAGTEPVLQRA